MQIGGADVENAVNGEQFVLNVARKCRIFGIKIADDLLLQLRGNVFENVGQRATAVDRIGFCLTDFPKVFLQPLFDDGQRH